MKVTDLAWNYPNMAKGDDADKRIKKAEKFCEGYKKFLDAGKTERECVNEAEIMLVNAGYERFDVNKKYKAGDKVYEINRGKSIIATTWGSADLSEGVRINGAHIDSPRLDARPNPLEQKDELAEFKTHYYGGILKYQWTTIPLSMHGTIIRKDGTKVNIQIGENEDDPVFYITDLLPHLSHKRDDTKTLGEAFTGEQLNVVVGSIPYLGEGAEDSNAVKLNVLKILYDKYKITEKDFARAEIEFVPAFKARDIGIDRSMIGAYGHDDRVCAYPALIAEIESRKPHYTTVTVLTDKEEIGSFGVTGLESDYLFDYIYLLAKNKGADAIEVCSNSVCLSADVNSAYDPTYPEVFEKQNSSPINHGVAFKKYTGTRGKSGGSDASAELMAEVIELMDNAGVYWQMGEIGACDVGGGGTIAKHVANHNIDVLDLGVPVFSMHAPYEMVAKLDVYDAYLAFKAFLV